MDNGTAQTAQKIRDIVTEVSSAFQEAARLFPALSKELSKSRLSAESGIEEIEAQKNDTRAQLGLSEDQENTGSSVFMADYSYLLELNSEEKELIKIFEGEVNKFFDLDESVSGIIDLTEDIQVIALNSLVKAAKSGQAGRGFAHLTQRLRQASSGLRALATGLQKVEHSTRDSFIDYKSEISEFSVFEAKIRNQLESLPRNISGMVDEFMNPFLEVLGNIGNSYDSMKASLYMIMETIQNQDIIAQSYEQIIQALSRISAPKSQGSEDLLNHYCFTEQVSGFCTELVQTTGTSISQISQTLLEQLQVLENHVDEVSTMQRGLRSRSSSGDLAGRIQDRIADIQEKSEYSAERKKEIGLHIDTIHESIMHISGRIGEFTDNVRKFMPVILTAKIEVAKRNELSELKGTITDLEIDILNLQEHVTQAAAVALQVSEVSEESAGKLRENSSKGIIAVEQLSATITRILNEVHISIKTMEELMRQFQVLSTSFSDIFSIVPAKINRLVKMEGEYIRIKEMFEKLGTAAEAEKQRLLDSMGIDSWIIKDDSLKELIDKFTIFSHKKLAGELTGITIEDKEGDEGEVLFF